MTRFCHVQNIQGAATIYLCIHMFKNVYFLKQNINFAFPLVMKSNFIYSFICFDIFWKHVEVLDWRTVKKTIRNVQSFIRTIIQVKSCDRLHKWYQFSLNGYENSHEKVFIWTLTKVILKGVNWLLMKDEKSEGLCFIWKRKSGSKYLLLFPHRFGFSQWWRKVSRL